jgi:hypothetical protein
MPLTDGDAAYVLLNLWQRGRDEMTVLGIKSPQLQYILKWKTDPRASFAIHLENSPIVVCGAFNMGEGEYSTWFLAVELSRRELVGMIPLLRGTIKERAQDIGMKQLNCFSTCIHPRAPDWFRAIGFHEVPHNSPTVRRFVWDFA